jgi:hypothetical protein
MPEPIQGVSWIPDTPPVGPITVPVTSTLFRTLEEGWDPMVAPGDRRMVLTMQLAGHQVRGFWYVTGLRADYAIAGDRTFWVTLAWVAD